MWGLHAGTRGEKFDLWGNSVCVYDFQLGDLGQPENHEDPRLLCLHLLIETQDDGNHVATRNRVVEIDQQESQRQCLNMLLEKAVYGASNLSAGAFSPAVGFMPCCSRPL